VLRARCACSHAGAGRAQATTTARMGKIRDLVQPMVAVCAASVNSADPQEELVMKTFEILFEMVGLPSKIMQPVLAPLIHFSMEVPLPNPPPGK
jgi:hypothetical protein